MPPSSVEYTSEVEFSIEDVKRVTRIVEKTLQVAERWGRKDVHEAHWTMTIVAPLLQEIYDLDYWSNGDTSKWLPQVLNM